MAGLLAAPGVSATAATTAVPETTDVRTGVVTWFDDDSLGRVGYLDVVAGPRLEPAAPHSSRAAALWQTFLQIATPGFVGDNLLAYGFAHAQESVTNAYATRGGTKWLLTVNTAMDEDTALANLVHEYGHMLTLDTEDLAPGVQNCTTRAKWESCLATGSLMWRFIERFWEPYWDTYGSAAPTWGNEDIDLGARFFVDHKTEFATAYAAVSAEEDLAETFAAFVLGDRPSGNSGAAQKVNFLYQDAEMVQVRDRIRGDLGLES